MTPLPPVAALATLAAREAALLVRRPVDAVLPAGFAVMVALLLPFAVGPDGALLARLAPGMVWLAVLLAALMPVPRLFAEDVADGTLDQLLLRGLPAWLVALARMLGLWALLALPLVPALPAVALFLGLPWAQLGLLAPGLAAGTLALAALGTLTGALVVGARGGGALVALVLLPLALPVLVFGARSAAAGSLRLLLAEALFLAVLAPLAAGHALRAHATSPEG